MKANFIFRLLYYRPRLFFALPRISMINIGIFSCIRDHSQVRMKERGKMEEKNSNGPGRHWKWSHSRSMYEKRNLIKAKWSMIHGMKREWQGREKEHFARCSLSRIFCSFVFFRTRARSFFLLFTIPAAHNFFNSANLGISVLN
jgi:hypothetical protein